MRRSGKRLSLTRLEDRAVPANLVVTDAGDDGAAGQLRTLLATANTNNEADTITFHSSITAVNLTNALDIYTEDRALTIIGNGMSATTIHAAAGQRIFELNVPGAQPTITISNLALQGGSTATNGGAILNANETLVLTNVKFTQNTAQAGGAVAIEAGNTTLTITGCDFTFNTATNSTKGAFLGGGGIFIGGAAAVTINNSTFDNNRAGTAGSALASANVALSLVSDSSTFKNGRSLGSSNRSGGAIFLGGGASTVVLDHATITGNSTAYRGGAIFNYNSGVDVTIKNSIISANISAHPGGAIFVSGAGSKLSLDHNTFASNTSPFSGAAVFSSQATLNVANSIFTGNSSGSQGGAIYSNGGVASITLSVFQNNTAANTGGALRVAGANTISWCDFAMNTAGNNGGAIHAAGTLAVAGSTFRGNTTSGNGGAINAASTLTVDQCTFNKNTAAGAAGGGAIAASSTAPLTINNSTIYDNTASSSSLNVSGAGVVRTSTGTLSINSSIIAANKLTSGTSANGRDLFSLSAVTIAGNHSLIGTNDNSNVTLTGAFQAGTNAAPINPLLNALGDNGGAMLPDGNRIQTMSLQPASPAVDQGNNTLGFAHDQRGSGYPRSSGQADVGAFEVQSGSPLPPTVNTVTFGDGTDQRSNVKQLVVNFSEAVHFMGGVASAFTLTRTGTGGATGNVTLSANPPIGPASSVTIAFSGSLTEYGSLVDGLYDFIISAAQVSGAGGALDGNNDSIPGGSYSVTGTTANKFYRLFGDGNGDATTGLADYIAFRAAFNLGANEIFDYGEGDNNVGIQDYIEFRKRFNMTP